MPTFTISSRFDAHNAAHLIHATLVVSVCASANKMCFSDIPHTHVDMPQYAGPAGTLQAVQQIVKAGAKLKEDDIVLIHCGQGICRSPAAQILLHLSWLKRMGEPLTSDTIQLAFDTLKSKRPEARPDKMMLILGDSELGLNGQLLEHMT